MEIYNHVIAMLAALVRSLQYGANLRIRPAEWFRYLSKSASLGLCYAGFASGGTPRQAWKAGEAAFLCSAYDVVTDWRAFDKRDRLRFETILTRMEVPKNLQHLALKLYDAELTNVLLDDGLERGAIAFRFTLGLMDCKDERALWSNLDEIGRLLQIVDDVLDYEGDIARGETNCLASSSRDAYLRRMLMGFRDRELTRLFGPKRSVLIRVIEKARIKATRFLAVERM